MKKVLFVAYFFPPGTDVGALRPLGLAKNFHRYGWEPIILTVQKPGQARDAYRSLFRVVETKPFDVFLFFRKLLHIKSVSERGEGNALGRCTRSRISRWFHYMFKAIFAFPDRHVGWYPTAVRAAKKIIAEEKIDLILSTSSPWTTALVARKLSVKFKIPWIADFRDLWSQNHWKEFKKFRNFCDRKLERWALKRARRLVVVSSERANKWRKLHKKKDIRAITLGFDEEAFPTNTIRMEYPAPFIICYAGKIKGQQDPEPLFSAIGELISDGKVPEGFLRVHIWGEAQQSVHDLVRRSHLESIVYFMPRISREEIIAKMQQAALLLNLNWNDPEEKGIHHGKLFDYLGARRPILSIGSQRDVVTQLLEETRAGDQLWAKDDIKRYLLDRIEEFRKWGQVPYRGIPAVVSRYGYIAITRKFTDLMDEVLRED